MSTLDPSLHRAWPNLLVILYTFLGWACGVWLLTRPQLGLNAAGVLLTAHTLVYSAYLIHECVHHTLFAGISVNDRLGMLLSWLNGACLANYQRALLKRREMGDRRGEAQGQHSVSQGSVQLVHTCLVRDLARL